MNLATLAIRNVFRRATRSTLVAFSVGLGVATALSLVALSASIENGTHEGENEKGADLTVLQRDAPDVFSGFIPESLGARIAAIPGVAAIAGELVAFAPIEHNSQRIVVGWPADSFFRATLPISEGRAPAPDARQVAVLGAGAAETLGKHVGDDLDILDQKFKVVAIAGYVSALNRSAIIVPLRDLQELLFKGDQVTVFHLRLASGLAASDVDRLSEQIRGLGRLIVAPTDQLLSNDRNLAILKAISRSTSIIALTMGSLSVLSALLMAVQERTREIGIMMAVGWGRRQTMASIVTEGAIIGAAGCVIGVVLGYLATFSFSSIPQIGDYLTFRPTIGLIVPTLLVAMALCTLGSLYPAWRATALTPAEAIRRI